MITEFSLHTEHEGLYDITAKVSRAVAESGVTSGICVVYCPHTTAAITINENADPDVRHDLLLGLKNAFPENALFRHGEGNSTAHLKSSCIGASETVLIEDGQLVLGTWQGIYFCEFDGPRTRRCQLKIIKG